MKISQLDYRLLSQRETIVLGRDLGALLQPGDVVGLAGELGSGKTWFAKGVALGLGVPEDVAVASPSFALVNEYEGRCALYHMDVYRLSRREEFFLSGLDEYFHEPGVVVMEWADRWPEVLPPWRLMVVICFSTPGPGRHVTVSGEHVRALEILQELTTIRPAT